MQRDDDILCFCVYTFGVISYLPRTEFVVIFDADMPEGEEVLGRVDWDDFARILGAASLEPIEGITPEWYQVMQPLDDAQIEQLRQSVSPI